jgi:hypothetical protein
VALSLDTAGRNWFALSGVRDHTIVYYKVVLGCEATHHVNFEYAIGYRLLLDPIVARVASRLRCIDPNSGR